MPSPVADSRSQVVVDRAPRRRLWLGAALLAVIALGLASRRFPILFPASLGKYPGDALWALMVFLGYAFLKPAWPTRRLAVAALATSCLVEFSQLYHAPWLDAVRATDAGQLVLGSAFSWVDLAAYTVGVAVGAGFDVAFGGAGRRSRAD